MNNLPLRHQHPSTIKIVVCNKNIRCSFGHFTINIRRENLSKKPSSSESLNQNMGSEIHGYIFFQTFDRIPITLVDSTSDLQCLHFRSWYV
ncbi:unnamed protein product [Rhizophagus irregularis]|nr:unnamed protein product [Rhizophagus irregularis]